MTEAQRLLLAADAITNQEFSDNSATAVPAIGHIEGLGDYNIDGEFIRGTESNDMATYEATMLYNKIENVGMNPYIINGRDIYIENPDVDSFDDYDEAIEILEDVAIINLYGYDENSPCDIKCKFALINQGAIEHKVETTLGAYFDSTSSNELICNDNEYLEVRDCTECSILGSIGSGGYLYIYKLDNSNVTLSKVGENLECCEIEDCYRTIIVLDNVRSTIDIEGCTYCTFIVNCKYKDKLKLTKSNVHNRIIYTDVIATNMFRDELTKSVKHTLRSTGNKLDTLKRLGIASDIATDSFRDDSDYNEFVSFKVDNETPILDEKTAKLALKLKMLGLDMLGLLDRYSLVSVKNNSDLTALSYADIVYTDSAKLKLVKNNTTFFKQLVISGVKQCNLTINVADALFIAYSDFEHADINCVDVEAVEVYSSSLYELNIRFRQNSGLLDLQEMYNTNLNVVNSHGLKKADVNLARDCIVRFQNCSFDNGLEFKTCSNSVIILNNCKGTLKIDDSMNIVLYIDGKMLLPENVKNMSLTL